MNSLEQMHADLMKKAGADPDFRQKLIDNPKDAVQDALGIEMPADMEVKVHQNDMNTVHLALPVTDLSEEQLEAVAAGRCCCCG